VTYFADVLLPSQKKYIMNVHGFAEENITVLMDDGEHESPTKANMINAYKKVIAESKSGDAIFLHYSGHGTKVKDDDGDDKDGYDEALVPLDYKEVGLLRDDDLYDILVKPMADGAHMVSLVSALCRPLLYFAQ
jgi:metacaspase-1